MDFMTDERKRESFELNDIYAGEFFMWVSKGDELPLVRNFFAMLYAL